jgi:branched-chain amino acid transport system ATP-binding protein
VHIGYEPGVDIVRGVDLDAAPGAITTIIGPNGAGKSTFLKGVAGLASITGGDVLFRGSSIVGQSPRERLEGGFAFVPQERSIFEEMTVEENLRMGAWILRADRQLVAERLLEVLEQFPDLAARRRQAAGELSGGQRKMLELARGLVLRPAILILDEPSAGLAPSMVRVVYERLVELRSQRRVTILLVDQNVREALAISDRVYVLAMGRNVAQGTATQIEDQLDDIVAGWMTQSESGVGRT